MKALVTTRFGHPPQMVVEDRSKPSYRDGFTVVRMHAATINQLSNTIRLGDFVEQSGPNVLGNEGSGVVEQSATFAPDTPVAIYGGSDLGVTRDGMFQQWVLVEDHRLLELPDAVDLDEGAVLTVNYLTAYRALKATADVQPGQHVLVSGATGGVGHALVQTARAFGAQHIAVVSSAAKADRARKAGATAVIDLPSQDLAKEVARITGGEGVDLALDPVGGPRVGELTALLRHGGALIAIGFTGGKTPSIDLVDIVSHEKRIEGYSLYAESDDVITEALAALGALAANGHLTPIIDSRYSLDDFESGYQKLMSREAIRSILLEL